MLRCIFLALSVVGVASSDAVAQKNLAAAQRDLALGEGKQWNTATPEEAQKLMDEEAALYAPRINCAFTPSSPIGFAASGKSQTECGEMFGKSFTGISTHKGWKCDWAVAEGSGGKTVIAWCPFKYTLDSTGEVVSSTSMLKYEFDDEGLIVGYFQDFDTSRFANAAPSVLAASPATSLLPMLAVTAVLGSASVVVALVRVLQHKPEPNGYEGLPA
ncbi:hypothetical protein AK812_SmicGene23727 [Symbiodinium microadriaticum]|uniref:Uncharacterized protein n=1 Tax=Symbiodinium microadriaticum TaxID=2951 RepID=A0A1Q9DGK4_SYMMI|nr:hypothetical protein AK812_SmicGene23727 [Symbiodinium microadriaticum]CAE7875289.1 unnamed protein product [Symbiodinium microadriaticum]